MVKYMINLKRTTLNKKDNKKRNTKIKSKHGEKEQTIV